MLWPLESYVGPTQYPEVLRSLSGTPSCLMRAISLAALAARSRWALLAVEAEASIPAEMMARSGFLETVASPLARTALSGPPVALVADRTLTRIGGRLATMTAAIATETAIAAAMGMTTRRTLWGIWGKTSFCLENAARASW